MWRPDDKPPYEGGPGSLDILWNPTCYVLVNPIGDDRISFAAGKEVNNPAVKDEELALIHI